MIKTETFRIIKNFVLVKPDPHYETYHSKGNDTGILVSNFQYEEGKRMSVKERHYSVTGEVFAIPSKIVCNTEKVKEISERVKVIQNGDSAIVTDWSLMAEKEYLVRGSVQYGTTVELSVGDRVRYSYTAHQHAKDNGMEVNTDNGPMLLIPYDKIFCAVDETNYPTKMVNGYVAVKSIMDESIQDVDGVSGQKTETGIFVVKNDREIKKRKGQKVEVVLAGTPLTSYFGVPDNGADADYELKKGDELLIDPRGKQRLEPYLHQHIEEDIFLIHRRMIIFENIGNFEEILL